MITLQKSFVLPENFIDVYVECYIDFIAPPRSILLDVSLTVKTATLIFISGRGSAISSAKKGKCSDIKPVRKEEGKSYWKIPLCDDDATREK